jgi:hypothetical protein
MMLAALQLQSTYGDYDNLPAPMSDDMFRSEIENFFSKRWKEVKYRCSGVAYLIVILNKGLGLSGNGLERSSYVQKDSRL